MHDCHQIATTIVLFIKETFTFLHRCPSSTQIFLLANCPIASSYFKKCEVIWINAHLQPVDHNTSVETKPEKCLSQSVIKKVMNIVTVLGKFASEHILVLLISASGVYNSRIISTLPNNLFTYCHIQLTWITEGRKT